MIIYAFWTHEGEMVAHTSLRKAVKARTALYDLKNRPEIFQIELQMPLTKQMACNLLMNQDYAVSMRDIA